MKECLVAGEWDGLARLALGRGCRPYIKALLTAQTAIGHECEAIAAAICECFIFAAEYGRGR
jgi:hypothetical protein